LSDVDSKVSKVFVNINWWGNSLDIIELIYVIHVRKSSSRKYQPVKQPLKHEPNRFSMANDNLNLKVRGTIARKEKQAKEILCSSKNWAYFRCATENSFRNDECVESSIINETSIPFRKTYGNLKSHQVKLNLFVWNPTTNFKRMKGHYVAKRGRQQRTLTEKLCFWRAMMKKWPFTTCWNLPLNMDAFLLIKMLWNNDSVSILYWRENTVWKSSNRSK
jgi:hypothetical protein